jgi:benzoyl-CoA reductase subunit C
MIVGSESDEMAFISMIEEKIALPATIVIDDHWTGSRYFWNEVMIEQRTLVALMRVGQ